MDKISIKVIVKNWIFAHKLPIIILAIILFSTGMVISEKVLVITENPSFCGKNCHIMRPYYDSWSASSHSKVRCVECHYEPGLIGHVKGKINGLMQFYSYETTSVEYSDQLFARVEDKNCLTCHEKRIFSSDINFNGVNFTHSDHPISLACTTCHSDVKHAPTIKAICTNCHANVHPKDWLVTHRTQGLFMGKVCSDCHLQKFCSDCHALGNASRMIAK
jgi:hypothetical protein